MNKVIASVVVVLAITAFQALAASSVQSRIATIGGPLEILKEKTDSIWGDWTITLNGKPLLEPDGQIKEIEASYPADSPARLVLISLSSGGTGCPYSFRVVEIKENATAVVSDEFGNCNALLKSPVMGKDGWLIQVHPIAGFVGQPHHTWVFKNGRLKDISH